MFFDTKQYEVVDIAPQDILELDSSNKLSFYIADIFKSTEVASVDYLPLMVKGRDKVPQGTYVNITEVAGNAFSFTYTPTGVAKGVNFVFRLKVTDIDGDEHYLHSDTYTIE